MEETPIAEQQVSHNEIVNAVIDKVEKNNFTIYFYCPSLNSPSGGIGVLLKQAKILKDNGFNAIIMYEPRQDSQASYKESQKRKQRIDIYEKFNPSWVGKDIESLQFKCLGEGEIKFNDGSIEKCEKIVVNAEDFVIIPEGFPNIMEKFSQIPCKKIVFAQSWYYILNSLPVNQNWFNFGIKDVISISDGISEYLNVIMPGLNIKQYSQSIDRNIFKPTSYTKKFPKIAYTGGRSQEAAIKTINVIKTFYCFYPQFKWIRFDELKGLTREEFAERLSESALALYTDEIAGFGTLPLEAMACGTHVVGWIPLGGKEYINTSNGYWAQNGDIFQLAELIGVALEKYLTSLLDAPEIQEEYEKTLERYTSEKETEKILNIYNEYKNERIAELQTLKQ